MLNISLQHKMMMKLSPQQVQYLKMLQLPTLALEQKIKAELEMNPLLEEGFEEETGSRDRTGRTREGRSRRGEAEKAEEEQDAERRRRQVLDRRLHERRSVRATRPASRSTARRRTNFRCADTVPLYHRLLEQFSLLDLDDEEILIGQEIIGNVDEDGYLRRDLPTIVQDLNLTHGTAIAVEKAEAVLKKIQRLDPVGIASPVPPGMPDRPARSCTLGPATSRPSRSGC